MSRWSYTSEGGGSNSNNKKIAAIRTSEGGGSRSNTIAVISEDGGSSNNKITGATTTPRRYDEIAGTSKMAADQAQTRLQAEEAPIAGHNAAAAVAPVTQHHRQRRWGRQRSSFEINSIQSQLNQL